MDIATAHKLLLEKLEEHGLTELGWKPNLDNAKKRFGYCSSGKKIISLSRPLTEANPEDEVLDTILHEIAHALADIKHGENCGHDERWKAVCREIGARPEACYGEDDVQAVDAPWQLVHRETGEVFSSYQRKPSKDFSEVWIRGRKDETLGNLVIRASKVGKIKNFTRPVLGQLSEELREAIEAVIADKGLTMEIGKGSFTDTEYSLSLKFRTELPDGKTPEQANFEENAFIFGLTADDYHKAFTYNSKTFVLCGLKPNNRKYPIIGMSPQTGGRFKFPLDALESLVEIEKG